MHLLSFVLLALLLGMPLTAAPVALGIDLLQEEPYKPLIYGKKIGLLTNHTGIDSQLRPTYRIVGELAQKQRGKLVALFCPEHGLFGDSPAEQLIAHSALDNGTPIYSLHGSTKKPTPEMLKGIDLLLCDLQDLGTRSYTYATTLFYLMEAAAQAKIPLVVFDRPNPINGLTIDGPMMEEKWRSFVGYIDVPYCHGMTIGELARFFNGEYHVGCDLKVVPMRGWQRSMSFTQTGLVWMPTSPQIPESTTALYYPITGVLGQLSLVSVGIGTTFPFKVVGAPWIKAEEFANKLNEQHFSGVAFVPLHFEPQYGKYAKQKCQGVLIVIEDALKYKPVGVQALLLGTLKNLYSREFSQNLPLEPGKIEGFARVCGTMAVYDLLRQKIPIIWPLQEIHSKLRQQFLRRRQPYLIAAYSDKDQK